MIRPEKRVSSVIQENVPDAQEQHGLPQIPHKSFKFHQGTALVNS